MSRYSATVGRIELDLDLHVLGDRNQRRGRLLDQHLARLVDGVDIGGGAVAVLGQRLHQRVVVVAHAEAEHREEDSLAALALDEALQLVPVGDADVEVAVGRQDHPIDPVGIEILLGQRIGLANALAAGGAAGASSCSITPRIFVFSDAAVGSSAVPARPA